VHVQECRIKGDEIVLLFRWWVILAVGTDQTLSAVNGHARLSFATATCYIVAGVDRRNGSRVSN